MSDLISKSSLIKRRRKVVEYDEAGFSMEYFAVPVEEINNAPTVEAKPVVKGKWIFVRDMIPYYRCSNCSATNDYALANFCPNCGCSMKKE